MADQKNQNQGTQDSQSRTPQGKQSSQQPTSENLKNRDKNRERDEERTGLTDEDRKKGAMDTRNEDRDNLQGRSRTSTTGSTGRDEDDDELNDETRRQERL